MLQACLNGGRDRAFHPAVPLSPDELADDARAVIEAGAQELHIHVRDAAGKESLHPDDVARALEAVRASVPGIPVGLSTGWWIPPKGRARQEHIRAWQVLPDYVSINLIEEDSAEVIDLVLSKGIGVEAGLWSAADAEKFLAHPKRRKMPAGADRAQRAGSAGGGTGAWRHPGHSGSGRHAPAAAAPWARSTRSGRSTAKRSGLGSTPGSGSRTASTCPPATSPRAMQH